MQRCRRCASIACRAGSAGACQHCWLPSLGGRAVCSRRSCEQCDCPAAFNSLRQNQMLSNMACSAFDSSNMCAIGPNLYSSKFDVSSTDFTTGLSSKQTMVSIGDRRSAWQGWQQEHTVGSDHLMGGSSLPLRRATQSMLRSHGWLLTSLTPDTKQPYLLLRSTCRSPSTRIAMMCMELLDAPLLPFHAACKAVVNYAVPAERTCNSFRTRSRTVTGKSDGKVKRPCSMRWYVCAVSSS